MQAMRLLFLGTSSGTPTRERNVAGAVLRFADGSAWVFDCGEGTQHRLLATDVRPGRIGRILITHLHGDHCFGLPGLLASITVHDRGSAPVEVIGPRGLERWWQVTRQVTGQGLSFPLHFTALDAAAELGERAGHRLTAVALDHRCPSYGYIVREPDRRGRFDPARAAALGVVPGPDFGRLAAGETVCTANGAKVAPEAVLGPTRPGRSIAIFGDAYRPAASSAAVAAALGCDLAVMECTYAAERQAHARKWRHSTTAMVAEFLAATGIPRVILTHFSSRYTVGDAVVGVDDLVREVEAGCPGAEVMAAHDGWEFNLAGS